MYGPSPAAVCVLQPFLVFARTFGVRLRSVFNIVIATEQACTEGARYLLHPVVSHLKDHLLSRCDRRVHSLHLTSNCTRLPRIMESRAW
jgi:hypothetical protein